MQLDTIACLLTDGRLNLRLMMGSAPHSLVGGAQLSLSYHSLRSDMDKAKQCAHTLTEAAAISVFVGVLNPDAEDLLPRVPAAESWLPQLRAVSGSLYTATHCCVRERCTSRDRAGVCNTGTA